MDHTFLDKLFKNITSETSHKSVPFTTFLAEVKTGAPRILRNIFQLFNDMIHYYVKEGKDEYPLDTESIGFLFYNSDELFINSIDKPFFADRLFANRLMNLANSFRASAARNKIYLFKGPAGSGKSTFLNNLLTKLEHYVRSDDGLLYEVVWKIPFSESPSSGLFPHDIEFPPLKEKMVENVFEVPCPNHDNPILMVPKSYRHSLLQELIPDGDFKKRLFKHKQYQWVFKDEPCTICNSMFEALSEKFPAEQIFSMVFAKRNLFHRKQGIGVSVFNSGDDAEKNIVKTNEKIQQFLNEFFKDSNKVRYLFSNYAHTNQGVMALMDLKAKNIQRFLDLHGIISDEVHKVGDIEERIRSLFIVLANPGDLENIGEQNKKDGRDAPVDTSLQDRIHEIKVPYVLDYNTEIKIYTNTFGEQIKLRFMPHVLENFGKTIVSSRIGKESEAITNWIKDEDVYEKYCDPDFYILKMDLYTGVIPEWLSKEDRNNLKADVRRTILSESETEGHEGFSGRESNQIFDEFYSKYNKKRPISMRHVFDFFMDENKTYKDKIPRDFLKHLTDLYDFVVLKEVKDSMYSFNDEEISKTILNYLVAITHNVGDVVTNPYLNNEELTVTSDFLDIVETHLMGHNAYPSVKERFREDAITEYASLTLAREMRCDGKKITETKQYQEMFQQFTKTARQNVLEPYSENNNFRLAIREFGTSDFNKYDSKMQERVKQLFKSLHDKYGYTEDCAKSVCLYVLDNKLVKKFES